MRNIKDSTFPENILEEIGINKVSEKKIDYSRLTDDQMCIRDRPITERHPGWILSEISRSVMMDTETVSGELWNKKNVFRESRVLSQI